MTAQIGPALSWRSASAGQRRRVAHAGTSAIADGELQVLTDEEKQLLTAQQQEQQSLNWLTRLDELQQEAEPPSAALQQALAEEEKAQPQLAALSLAQPARNLRPALGTHRRTRRGAGAYSPAD
ncbi:hypothetical protein ACNKHW_02160 [Shigella flexneri]